MTAGISLAGRAIQAAKDVSAGDPALAIQRQGCSDDHVDAETLATNHATSQTPLSPYIRSIRRAPVNQKPPLALRLSRAPGVMAAAIEVSPPASPQPAKHAANDAHTRSCPSCGHSLNTSELDEARRKIEELEAQMERLKEKATAAGTRPSMRQISTRNYKVRRN